MVARYLTHGQLLVAPSPALAVLQRGLRSHRVRLWRHIHGRQETAQLRRLIVSTQHPTLPQVGSGGLGGPSKTVPPLIDSPGLNPAAAPEQRPVVECRRR